MKHLVHSTLAFFFCLFLTAATVGAQQITIDLGKMDSQLAAQVIKEQQRINQQQVEEQEEEVDTADQAQKWASIGENVAKAIAAAADALSIQVNEFVKTPVGQWTLFFVFWYIMGETVWAAVIGSLIWLVLGLVIWHSFRIFHIPKTVEVDLGGGKKDKKLLAYEFASKDAKMVSTIFHAAAFVLLSIVMIIVIL